MYYDREMANHTALHNNSSHHHESLDFPKKFLWGTATSAHQVEGNNTLNDWWEWEQRGRVQHDQKSGTACDHYHRFEQDFDLALKMHNNAHRLSIEWSRLQPAVDGWDYAEVKHYRQVLQALKYRGMKTFVTLHHFTNPVWFMKSGGWLSSLAAPIFARYARFAAEQFGDLVDYWTTINEPMIFVTKGYFEGSWPPGKRSLWLMLRALANMEHAHRLAYAAIHETKKRTQVGIAHNMFSYTLYRPHNLGDKWFMAWLDRFWNHRFLDHTAGCHDFLGLNYYFHYRLRKFNFRFKQFFIDPREEQRDVSDIGWEVYPPGIAEALIDLNQYHLPIYITENGIATNNDDRRVRYLLSYLKEVHTAIASGVDVRGYFYWSLIDNFEWERGYTARFGLVNVDFKNQKRTMLPSGQIYGTICQSNSIPHALLRYLGHGQKVTQ